MLRKCLSFLLLVAFCPGVLSQSLEITQPSESKAAAEAAAKLQAQALLLLREAMGDANNLRSLENRITFSAELGGMMWPHDEREARLVFGGVISDLREMIILLDGQMNANEAGRADAEDTLGILGETDNGQRIVRRFATVMSVRQTIARNLAEHDAEMAYGFYYNTGSVVTNPDLRRQIESRDGPFEMQLLTQALSGNSPRTTQLALRSMEKGFKPEHVEFLIRLHAQDADKAADLAASILARLRAEKVDVGNYAAIASLLKFGGTALAASRTAGGRRAAYSQAELRDIAELLAQSILAGRTGYGGQYAVEIDKYSPGRGAQIRARVTGAREGNVFNTSGSAPPPPRPPGSRGAISGGRGQATGRGDGGSGRAGASAAELRAQQQRAENKLLADIASLATISKERRESVIAEVRKTIAQTSAREKKITALGMLAAQVAKLGDKELAADIMAEASSLAETDPRNYRDFLLAWMLIGGHAAVDPQKAFPLLEDTILRINEPINAFIKVGEFIDASGEIIADGEVQIGAFGGSMMRGFTGELATAEPTLRSLAAADFERTKELASKFERPEARILAKMIILRAVLKRPVPPAVAGG